MFHRFSLHTVHERRGEKIFTGSTIQKPPPSLWKVHTHLTDRPTGITMNRPVKLTATMFAAGLLFAGLATIGCSSDPGNPDTDSETHWGLPNHDSIPGDNDCPSLPEDEREYELDEWVGTADGMIIGDVVKVEPALDLGWTSLSVSDNSQLRTAEDCKAIHRAFSVKLDNIRGVLHDHDLPDEKVSHFGWEAWASMPDDQRPDIDEDGVHWPTDGIGIGEGMRIGGLVSEEPKLTNRWSFRMSPYELRPLFEVEDDEIVHQAHAFDVEHVCKPIPPLETIEALGESELLSKLDDFQQQDQLFVDPEERRWSVRGFGGYDEEPPRLPSPGSWVGECELEPQDDPRDCQDDSDCPDDLECSGGECVECMQDSDCDSTAGEICTAGECIEPDG